ncbi:GNAT family N-acetyltransferase [Mesobacterium sp. TK19101]|uniref:GNAT family N-acetyltransferase n=1 Tax=Mesobacterium hydrothermale TaxID=3111907 RepID=A0ABU6HI33_9RHOB|nr:GNAT family N-acetyltransferase [Mesobacterium sp. TK19101]MEC3861762.1 GNAT family N-acetyltransferase [Mesobacterium sp. TK19101]
MIQTRRMTVEDLNTVLDWAAEEGWNPGLDDPAVFLQTDPDGFFLALDGDQPVAAISVVNHSDDFSFLGLYICRASHRGRGIGLALWTEALEHAGARTVGLDGVQDQQANYARSGFRHAGGTTRYSGTLAGYDHRAALPVEPADVMRLVVLEAGASGWEKRRYLQGWFTDTAHRKTFVVSEGERITGFATVRACRDGAKIGPLSALDEATALVLLEKCADVFAGEIIVDVPSSSDLLNDICNELGLVPGFQTARMYRGPSQPGASRLFAVASLELG